MKQTSLFIDFMGDSPIVRLFDYFLTERDLDFSISDIARNTKIGRATLYRHWDSLQKNQILLYTRTVGKARLYRLNTQNVKVKKLMEIDDLLVLEDLKKRAEKGKAKVEA